MQNNYYVYLGGNHLDQENWRRDFTEKAAMLSRTDGITLSGIDPFHRSIDETDNGQIISRDITILSDPKVQFVILKTLDNFGSLSTGTACEMMIARSMGKHVVIFHPEEQGAEPQRVHPFTEHFASCIVWSLTEAILYIKKVLTAGSTAQDLQSDISRALCYPFEDPDINPFIIDNQ